MTAARSNAGSDAGALLPLAHTAALARLVGERRRPSARARLDRELGPELARRLVAALVARPRRVS